MVVQRGILLTIKNPIDHGTAVAAGYRRVNGCVDLAACVSALEGAVGQVIVPGNHRETALFFVKIVIVNHRSGVAVAVADKIVDHKIAEDLVDIQNALQTLSLAEGFQGGDQPGLVRLGDVRFGVLEDVGVAVRVVVNVPELYVVAAHAAAGTTAAMAFAFGSILRAIEWLSLGRRGEGTVFAKVHNILHIKFPAVAPAPAKAHAVRLIELAGVTAVIPPEEAVLHALYRQVQPPILAVHCDVDIAAKGCVHTEGSHHLIGKVVLHIGGVLNDVVQAQLIQAVVGPAAVVVVELQLEAVAVAVHGGNHGERGVSLGPDGGVLIGFAVDDDRALGVFLVLTGLQETVPAVHDDIDGVDLLRIEKPGLIAHNRRGGPDAQGFAVHEPECKQQTEDQGGGAEFVYVFVG